MASRKAVLPKPAASPVQRFPPGAGAPPEPTLNVDDASTSLVVKILVVDDSPTIRLSIGAAIRQARPVGATVYEAQDLKSAVDQFKRSKPDVVFLDMLLGENDKGLDVLRKMLSERPDARIVLLTGLPADDPEVRKAIMEGAFAHVQKPIRSESVRKVLNEVDEETGRFGRIR